MAAKLSRKDLLNDPDFKDLQRKKTIVSTILTILELIIYFGFVALIAFNKPFLSMKISGAITAGIPIAIGAIILSWVLTGIYIWWANTSYDVMVRKIREKVEA